MFRRRVRSRRAAGYIGLQRITNPPTIEPASLIKRSPRLMAGAVAVSNGRRNPWPCPADLATKQLLAHQSERTSAALLPAHPNAMAPHHDRAVRLSILSHQLHPEGGYRYCRRVHRLVVNVGLMNAPAPSKRVGSTDSSSVWVPKEREGPMILLA